MLKRAVVLVSLVLLVSVAPPARAGVGGEALNPDYSDLLDAKAGGTACDPKDLCCVCKAKAEAKKKDCYKTCSDIVIAAMKVTCQNQCNENYTQDFLYCTADGYCA